MWYREQAEVTEAPTFSSMATYASRSKGSVLAGLDTDAGGCHHLHILLPLGCGGILLPLDLEVIVLSHHDGEKFTEMRHPGSAKASTLKFKVAELIPGVRPQGMRSIVSQNAGHRQTATHSE